MLFGRVRRMDRERAIRRVLIVEDEPLVAFDNEHLLADDGYVVAGTVDSHAGALAAIAAGGVDLVIADVALRGPGSGIDVAAHAHGLGLPVLFVTGACPPDARDLAYGCLAKPYAPRDLLAAIRVIDALVSGTTPPRAPTAMHVFQRIG